MIVNDEERVRAGVTLLSERRSGWQLEIDLDRLSLTRDCDCVLGQLYGTYHAGTRELRLRNREPAGYGFVCTWPRECRCVELTAVWKRVIEEMRRVAD